MKYQNTSRTLSFLFHSIILLAFGALGFYFGFFVVPLYFTNEASYFTGNLVTPSSSGPNPFFLSLELAVVGLVFFLISLYGVIEAVKGLMDPSNDAPVVKSLTAFVAEGWVASVFFLLQGTLLFDLTASKNVAFVIIMSLLFAILLLIATNIPMVRLYDGKDQSPLFASLSLAAGLVSGVLSIETFLSLIGSWLRGIYSWSSDINILLGFIVVVSLLVAALSIVAALLIKKNPVKNISLAGYLNSASVALTGLGLLFYGVMDIVWQDHLVHFASPTCVFTGYGFSIMCLILGVLILAGAGFFVASTYKDSKKPLSSKAKAEDRRA